MTAPCAGLGDYWAHPANQIARALQSGPRGLSSTEAAARLRQYGRNAVRDHRGLSRLRTLLDQLRSPLLLLLIFAAAASGLTGEWFDAGVVLAIVGATVTIGYSREYSAQAAADALRRRMHIRVRALRDGRLESVASEEIVPGDVVVLSAGNSVPADAVILEASHLFVSEAVLTGESFPVEKRAGIVRGAAGLAQRTNCVFLGTNIRSGSATCLVVHTGVHTQFGAIAGKLTLRAPDTEFDLGVRRFGYLLTSAMTLLMLAVFTVHVLQGRPAVETLLFAIALAVGLSPELLPAILSVNLARGAQMLAQQGVLVRRLNAIENLGSMDILCTDKTGTLTEGSIRVQGAYNPNGDAAPAVLDLAACNAALETGLDNPLDDAILAACRPDLSHLRKLAELPFDFVRKRVSVVVNNPSGVQLITKGAFQQVIALCTHTPEGNLDSATRTRVEAQFTEWSNSGLRVLAIATRPLPQQPHYTSDLECEMSFAGFLTFLDRPKEGVTEALTGLARLGVSTKMITGDNALVARHVAALVGLRAESILTGQELDELHDEALWHAAERTDVFAEVDPNQKERIILALKKMGHVVGFLGDGVNDAPAMHAADASLSVEQAVDVARDAADFVLLERGLDVIRRGVQEGRKTFANTLKYVLITTSANLGNMVSMAAASMWLPFLPLLASQILLNNFLSDIPAIGLANDRVDPELVDRPRRWDIDFIARFMVVFGLVSSIFDVITFAVLRFVFVTGAEVFRTGWFVESLLTELAVALVVRTRRPFFQSSPGTLLLRTTVAVALVTVAIPFVPLASYFGFVPLGPSVLGVVMIITLLYVCATELAKRAFYRRVEVSGAWNFSHLWCAKTHVGVRRV